VLPRRYHVSNEDSHGFRANRRDVLKTATGLAAAAVVAGAIIEPHSASAAPKGTPGTGGRITLRIEDGNPIEVYSFSWGVSNPVTIGSGSGGAGAGKASLTNLQITKGIDAASIQLQRSVFNGQHWQAATLTVADAKGKELFNYRFDLVFVVKADVVVDPSDAGVLEVVEIACGGITLTTPAGSYNWSVLTNSES
jgi:type VI protein secretion system component Hcp